MREPRLLFCGVRDGGDVWHLECRFEDGQKFAAVQVAIEFEALATDIAAWLTLLLKGMNMYGIEDTVKAIDVALWRHFWSVIDTTIGAGNMSESKPKDERDVLALEFNSLAKRLGVTQRVAPGMTHDEMFDALVAMVVAFGRR